MGKIHKKVPRHIIGGVALTNGVILHTPDTAVLAYRDLNDQIVTKYWKLPPDKEERVWLKWFGVRGIWLLWRSIVWNGRARAFVSMADKQDHIEFKMRNPNIVSHEKHHRPPASLFPFWGVVAAILLYLDIIVLISLINDIIARSTDMVVSDLIALILTSVLIGFMAVRVGIWEYMGYHGAEHQAIHAFEDGKHNTDEIEHYWPYQSRCGAAVVSYVALGLIFLGLILPNLSFLWSLLVVAVLFSLSYELVMLIDRHPGKYWADFLGLPGVFLQMIVARKPRAAQSEVAAVALSELTKHSVMLGKHTKLLDQEMPLD